ncbi:thioesterase family protein [Mumia zhuanghuii]|uniref:Thioesterase family protein n=1 Tax=Mumia zhuanghuii TaxID=2585211 RepID=A0A5Q6RYU3_9ACTN|nr:thioesterase family protein [Mumia zhuanghuii]
MPATSFYERVGARAFLSTAATESPWDAQAQHGGPPAALLTRAIEDSVAGEGLAIGKIDLDFLGPIPQGTCEIEVTTLRPGRRVRLVQAVLSCEGRPAVGARAWLVSYDAGRAPRTGAEVVPPALPGPQPQPPMPGAAPEWGYGRAIEWRYVSGGLSGQAPVAADGVTRAWMRVRVPLVAGEPTSDLQRLMVIADSANGVSARLPFSDWLFIPPGLGVTAGRPPSSEWMLLEASSWSETRGTGVAHARVLDSEGLCAFVAQPLLVAPRG